MTGETLRCLRLSQPRTYSHSISPLRCCDDAPRGSGPFYYLTTNKIFDHPNVFPMLLYTYVHFVDICANLFRGFEYRYLVVDYLCCQQ